ncbi:lipoyl synthase, partial [bacterium]
MNSMQKPHWLRNKLTSSEHLGKVRQTLDNMGVHTVCSEAKCPNRNHCYSLGQATFLIMGDTCTRNCKFCAIHSGDIEKLDPNEPTRVAQVVKELKLKYAVITSVTRDDIPDGGANHFAETICRIRELSPDTGIEILVPDFLGDEKALSTVLDESPDVFNHNVETIPRLYD